MKSINVMAQLLIILMLVATRSATAQQPTPPPQPRDESIRGRVINEGGQPIPGVDISLDVLGGYMGHRASTDNDGNFKIAGLDSGVYRLYLYSPGYVMQLPNSDSPTYRTGDRVEVTMMKGAVIAGNVINSDGDPIVNVQVRAYRIR